MSWVVRKRNEPNVYEAANAEILLRWTRERRIDPDTALTTSNGTEYLASDLPWLSVVFGAAVELRCPSPSCNVLLQCAGGSAVFFDPTKVPHYRCRKCGRTSSLVWSDLDSFEPRIALRPKPLERSTERSCPKCRAVVTGTIPDPVEADYERLDCCPNEDCGATLIWRGRTDGGVDLVLWREPSSDGDWERDAIARLTELLSDRDLRTLAGELHKSIRFYRKALTGEDRPSRKDELARALLVRHAEDLFADPDIREVVARRAGVRSPKRWLAGKASAYDFVLQSGFPLELAGSPSDPRPDDFEFLESRPVLPELQDFQREVLQKLLAVIRTEPRRAIVSLPTGAGKTRTAVEAIREWMTVERIHHRSSGHLVLWLAHTEELCDQAYSSFADVWSQASEVPPVLLFRFWGSFSRVDRHFDTLRQIELTPSILVSTPARIETLLADDRKEYRGAVELIGRALRLLVVDEAHRAAAPSYRRILRRFGGARSAVIGLTATPFRGEYHRDPEAGTRELVEIFGQRVEPTDTLGSDPRTTLQQRRVLAGVATRTVDTGVRIAIARPKGEMSSEVIEAIDRQLSTDADRSVRRRHVIFQAIRDTCSDAAHSILYFGPSVADAEQMAYLLRADGVPAAFVSGATRPSTRRRIVRDFKIGEVRVLCNCEVLTTGFDAPRVTHVVVARPTVSRVLYEQMIGRGLRGPLFGGTTDCVIFNCADSFVNTDLKPAHELFNEMWKPVQLD